MLSSAIWDDLSFPEQDLTPLSQPLLPLSLALNFGIPVPDSASNTDGSGSTNPSTTRQPVVGGPIMQGAAACGNDHPTHNAVGYMQQHQQPLPQQHPVGNMGSMMAPPPQNTVNLAAAGFPPPLGSYTYSQAMPQFQLPPGAQMGQPGQPAMPPAPYPPGFPYAMGPSGFPYPMQDPAMYFPHFGAFPHGMFSYDYPRPPALPAGRETGELTRTKCEEGSEETQTRALKRPRLVWTPQLHKCFVDAVNQIGLDKAVPKQIMQVMNVDGLTRENVASHLQKYRLQLKRDEGGGGTGSSGGEREGGGGTRDKAVAAKKKRRRVSSAFEESRGCGSPAVPHDTEGFGSTDKMPEDYPAPAASHSGEVIASDRLPAAAAAAADSGAHHAAPEPHTAQRPAVVAPADAAFVNPAFAAAQLLAGGKQQHEMESDVCSQHGGG